MTLCTIKCRYAGSVREERHDVLVNVIESLGMETDQYGWYLDLRRFGTVPHAGFGLGFERLILFTTGIVRTPVFLLRTRDVDQCCCTTNRQIFEM